jgi:hypothetical protein
MAAPLGSIAVPEMLPVVAASAAPGIINKMARRIGIL